MQRRQRDERAYALDLRCRPDSVRSSRLVMLVRRRDCRAAWRGVRGHGGFDQRRAFGRHGEKPQTGLFGRASGVAVEFAETGFTLRLD